MFCSNIDVETWIEGIFVLFQGGGGGVNVNVIDHNQDLTNVTSFTWWSLG